MNAHPIRIRVADDLRRSRLTVFFRLLLVIPHAVWFGLWSIAAFVAAVVNWVATLVLARPPAALHRFLSAYLRYGIHVGAYLYLAANPFPGFLGRPGYPLDVEIDPPQPQHRLVTLFRVLLVLPALVVVAALSGWGGGTSQDELVIASGLGAGAAIAFFAWFASLFAGRMPLGFRNALAFVLRYSAQTYGYLILLTDRYPTADPALPDEAGGPPEHPVRLEVGDDLRRSRLTVLFRLLLALPHLVWIVLWGIAAFFAAIGNWAATLVKGSPPASLHRFLSAFVRYQTHLLAYVMLTANPFPGFVGKPGYPIDLEIAGPAPQVQGVTFFRLPLAVPALVVAGALASLLYAVAFLGWFAALALGRMPEGFRNAGAWVLRYSGQTSAYLYVLTDRYPHSSPPA